MGILNLGFDSKVPADNVVYIGDSANTSTMKKIVQKALAENKVIDCCKGKVRRSVVLDSNGFVYFSHISADTLGKRLKRAKKMLPEVEEIK